MIELLMQMQAERKADLLEKLESSLTFNKEMIKGQIFELEVQMELLKLATHEQEVK